MTPDETMAHASDWSPEVDPTGWIITEKVDGFFARWTGAELLTRYGESFNAPAWFTRGLPVGVPLDCEVWPGYVGHSAIANCQAWRDKDRWRTVRLFVFDVPQAAGSYSKRNAFLQSLGIPRPHIVAQTERCRGADHLLKMLSTVLKKGGEGLVIRHPDAPYTPGRVRTMLKVK